MDNLQVTSFANINLKDPFFDSLRANYDGFDDWFNKKASSGANALVYYNDAALLDFLYLKDENEALPLDVTTLPQKRRLKVGTFKIDRRGTNRGERFMKRILDIAIIHDFQEVCGAEEKELPFRADQGYHQGKPRICNAAGNVSHPCRYNNGVQRYRYGSCHNIRACMLQPCNIPAEKYYPQGGASALLYCCNCRLCNLCKHNAGRIFAKSFSGTGRVLKPYYG